MLKKGTKIIKINSQPGDTHQDGARGVITETLEIPEDMRETVIKAVAKAEILKINIPQNHVVEGMYWVNWDDMPMVQVMVTDYRVKEI